MAKEINLDTNLTEVVPAHRTWPVFTEYLQAKKEALENEHGRGFALADTMRLILVSQDDFSELTGVDQAQVLKKVLGKTKNW